MIALKPDEVAAFTISFVGAAVAACVLTLRWYRRAR